MGRASKVILASRRVASLVGVTGAEASGLALYSAVGMWSKQTAAARTQTWASELCRRLGLDVTVLGSPADGPALYVPNHRSYTDVIAIASQMPCTFLAKSEVGTWPFFGKAVAVGGTLFVERGSKESRRSAREAIAKTLEAGVSVVVFPEGTSTAEPLVRPFKQGLFQTAADLGVPVVPMALHYKDSDMPWVGDDTFLAHFYRVFGRSQSEVLVHFGPTLREKSAERLRGAAWHWCNCEVRRLCGATQMGVENG